MRRGRFGCLSVAETWWLDLVVVRMSFQQKCAFPLLMVCLNFGEVSSLPSLSKKSGASFSSTGEDFYFLPGGGTAVASTTQRYSLLLLTPLQPFLLPPFCSLPHVPIPQLVHCHDLILRVCLHVCACTEEKPSALKRSYHLLHTAFFCMASFFA